MRKLAAFMLFVILLLTACRPEAERSALARSAPRATGTPAADGGNDALLRCRPEPTLRVRSRSRLLRLAGRRGDVPDDRTLAGSGGATSPDGSRLAFVTQGSRWNGGWVGTMPASGGAVTELFEVPPDTHVHAVQWTPDGRSLLYTTRGGGQDEVESAASWSIPADGGEARRVRLVDPLDPQNPRLHPEGRSIAFMAGESRGEVWVMEGLDESTSTTAERGDSR